ncbi:hypothetical protein MPSEU_000818200 [Mayamaea pseudoterrestris]|nr:hypothetical protein MPSEU_000818200 [Mayamaea pseudoterrestris]
MASEPAAGATSSDASKASIKHHESAIPDILTNFYAQMRRIDELEHRLEHRTVKTRRRCANLLNLPHQSHRKSHLRLFVTHSLSSGSDSSCTAAAAAAAPPTAPEYQLLIEGRLLVDHLDYVSAAEFDKRIKYTSSKSSNERSNDKNDLEGGISNEESRQAVNFTHLFDNVTIEFQTFYQPKPHPMARIKSPPTKSGRRGGTSKNLSIEEQYVDPSTLVASHLTTKLGWTRNMTPDARAWVFKYQAPPPPGHHLQHYQVVCRIHLLPHRPEELYRASSKLASFMFPSHGPSLLKRKADDMTQANMTVQQQNQQTPLLIPSPPPPMDNEIDIPHGLTMTEVTKAFFVYIQDRNLVTDPSDKSIIHCDATLGALFQTDRLVFSQLQTLLLHHQLLEPITRAPVELIYVMRPTNAEASVAELQQQEQQLPSPLHHLPALLQVDMDVAVPSLFGHCIRQLLRRTQHRQAEYGTARNNARTILLAGTAASVGAATNPVNAPRKSNQPPVNAVIVKQYEDAIQRLMDQALIGNGGKDNIAAAAANSLHGLGRNFIPLYAALQKGAPADSEASQDARMDQALCLLVEELKEECQSAGAAWKMVRAATHIAADME